MLENLYKIIDSKDSMLTYDNKPIITSDTLTCLIYAILYHDIIYYFNKKR